MRADRSGGGGVSAEKHGPGAFTRRLLIPPRISVHRIWWHAAHRQNRGESTTRNAVSRTSAVPGRTKLSWGRRERQPDGTAAGGHPHFFRGPIIVQSARNLPSGFT
jgi:hypothetical protein